MISKLQRVLLCALVCVSCSAHATATYDFSAAWGFEVQAALAAPSFPIAPTSFFSASNSITGRFTYDSSAPLLSGPGPSIYAGAITDLTANIGGYSLSDASGYGVAADATDFFGFYADPDVTNTSPTANRNIAGFTIGDWTLRNFRLFWTDDPTINGNLDILNGEALPDQLPPGGFAPTEARIALDFVNSAGDQRHIAFFNGMTVTAVPEPSSFGLLALGFFFAVYARRKTI